MYYVIRDCGVTAASSLKMLNKKMSAKFDQDEFTIVGKDFIVRLNSTDYDFVRDKLKMENLLFAGFFRKDNTAKLLGMINLIFSFILLILVGRLGG